MGKRGRNRKGYYLTMLYVLELHYALELHRRGDEVDQWRPSPKNRPDQFLDWIQGGLATLDVASPANLAELTRELERRQLGRIARVLEYVVVRQAKASSLPPSRDVRFLDLALVREAIGGRSSAVERHPQARKYARAVSEALDEAWLGALQRTASEYLAMEGLPATALLLGGLPPCFRTLSERIFEHLHDDALLEEHRYLTAFQFYGLVTGSVPPAPVAWQEACDALCACSDDDVRLLAGLSTAKIGQIRTLADLDGRDLWQLRSRLRASPERWMQLGATLSGAAAARTERGGPAHDPILAQLETHAVRVRGSDQGSAWLRSMAGSALWDAVGRIDHEVALMVDRGDLHAGMLGVVGAWSCETWIQVWELLSNHRDWTVAYVQDRRTLERLFESRTGGRLNVREVFPKTIAWLDTFLHGNLLEVMMNDVGDLERLATTVSRRTQEHLWTRLDVPQRHDLAWRALSSRDAEASDLAEGLHARTADRWAEAAAAAGLG